MSGLIGYQENTTWMGAPVLTLADIFPEQNPRAVIVGLNPAPSSVEAGHYYQGNVGQRQLRRLADVGLFTAPDGRYFEEAALSANVGLTDIVKRPTTGEGDVSTDEIRFGTSALMEKLGALDVQFVVCVFRHPVKALLGHGGKPGIQTKRTPWGAQVFRMPGPFDSSERVSAVMRELSEALATEI